MLPCNDLTKENSILYFAYMWQGILGLIFFYFSKINGLPLYSFILFSVTLFVFSIFYKKEMILILKKPYAWWESLGRIMGGISSFILLSVIYILVFIPIGIFFKLLKRDVLERNPNKNIHSYWKKRITSPESMTRQF